ncbi:solute carrier organic anion transporter family member 4A1 [Dasypus novemcinctus]|uniref:solute carrier organic anion transporter family member 4A1 n=1 Tax=Dasypus novemcinctus TaxID=9361 RepID=UPI00265DF4E4|nr:solute carrier organic anion transporter family member 4A1 [Dasypus novemcinctus]
MPQCPAEDKFFVSPPPRAFPAAPAATEHGPGSTPPGRGTSLGPATPLPPGPRGLPPGEPRAGRRGAAAGPEGAVCGWCALAPACLRAFHTPRGLLLVLCAASFLQGMTVNGLINTVVTSLERRFNLRSSQSGLIASSYDIAACLCLTFVSYVGGRGHKPRWLGHGVLLMGVGSLVFALPHFAAGRYAVDVAEDAGTCRGNWSAACAGRASGLSGYRLLFVLGQLLHGLGATPLYTLGVTYLDESVESSRSPVYIGIFYTAAILGPAAGYMLGGALLNIYTEVGRRTALTTESPQWVGAWWIGFLGAGGVAFLIALPILSFPRQLPGSQRYVAVRASETQQLKDGPRTGSPDFGKTMRDLPLSIWLLLKNPPFVLLCLAGATEATLVAGMSTFGPKFLESQFSLSASEAATLFGYLVVPAGGGGTFLGGFLVNKLKLRGAGVVKLCLLCTLAGLLGVCVFTAHCPSAPVAGVTAAYDGGLLPAGRPQLTATCNAACHCPPVLHGPVCGSDGVTYLSPCHAGCATAATMGPAGRQTFHDCSCASGNSSSAPGRAVAGKCASPCRRKALLLVLVFAIILFTFLSSIPALTATLRCVPDQQRSFALGIQWIVVRTLGSIPGPIAFGWAIDRACLLWQDECGQPGACLVYQNAAMSRSMLVVGLAYKGLGLLFFAAACCLHRPPSGPPSGLEASLPSQSSASDSPPDPQQQSHV